MAMTSSRPFLGTTQPFAAARSTVRPAAARPMVLAMAKPVAASTLRGLSAEEIDSKVAQLKADMFAMRIKFAKREDYKKSEYLGLKRQIAQLLTVRREQEIAAGVDGRASRAAERQRLVDAGLGKFAPKSGKRA